MKILIVTSNYEVWNNNQKRHIIWLNFEKFEFEF